MFSILWLGFAFFDLFMLWRIALKTHENLKLLQAGDVETGLIVQQAFAAAANLTNWALFYAVSAVGACLVAVIMLLTAHGTE
jgi:hypothetical protein